MDAKTKKTEARAQRRARILQHITAENPLGYRHIMVAEGVSDSLLRRTIRELEIEHGIKYFGTAAARVGSQPPIGLSESTFRFRSKLANELYKIVDKPNKFGLADKSEIASKLGLNAKAQQRAINNPYDHDWTLGQIERLARLIGEEPWDLMQRCLST